MNTYPPVAKQGAVSTPKDKLKNAMAAAMLKKGAKDYKDGKSSWPKKAGK